MRSSCATRGSGSSRRRTRPASGWSATSTRAPALTVDDLAGIDVPALLLFADNDGEVRVDHLHAMHEALPRAHLAILPGTGHGLPADKPELCARLIADFVTEVSR